MHFFPLHRKTLFLIESTRSRWKAEKNSQSVHLRQEDFSVSTPVNQIYAPLSPVYVL